MGETKLVPGRIHIGVDYFWCLAGAREVPYRRRYLVGVSRQQGAKGNVVSLYHYSANIEDIWCHYSAKCVEEVWCQEGGNGMWCPGDNVWCPPGVNVTQEQKNGTAQGSGILVPGT